MDNKLILLDVSNTLVKIDRFSNIWESLNEKYGVADQDKQLYKLWKQGQLSYTDWVKQDFELYASRGATKEELYQFFTYATHVDQRARKLLSHLSENNNTIVTLSESLDVLLDAHDIAKYINGGYINHLAFNEDGTINFETSYATDFFDKNKVEGLKELIDQSGYSVSDCIFIGDGDNDVHIAKYLNSLGGTSVSYNGTSDLSNVSTHVVTGDYTDLYTLLFKPSN